MVNVSEIFLGGMLLEVNLVFVFKDTGWTRNFFIDKI